MSMPWHRAVILISKKNTPNAPQSDHPAWQDNPPKGLSRKDT
jgi:hypothetical protein